MDEKRGQTTVQTDDVQADAELVERKPSLSQKQLIWRRLKRHRLGMVGAVVVLMLVVISIFAPFFSPYNYMEPDFDRAYTPPQRVRIRDADGNWRRPFVYGLTRGFDEQTWRRTYVEDTDEIYPIRFFIRDWEYGFLGITSNVHLFGVEEGGPLYLLGTDHLGRDMLSRIIHGSRISLFIGVAGSLVSALFGSFIGGWSGYFAGKVDMLLQRFVELLQLFPQLPLMMALSAAIPTEWPPFAVFIGVVFILALVQWTWLAREVRGKVLSYRDQDFVLATKTAGGSDLYIIAFHILPNCFSHIIVVVTVTIPHLILAESALSFLGLGIQPPMVSWGVLLSNATDLQTIGENPWILIPGLFILLTILALNFFGDGLRDAADPYS